MDADLKAKWVKALRSGKYEQGEGSLYQEGRYCCLGVLCRVIDLPYEGDTPCGRPDLYRPLERLLPNYRDLTHMNDTGESFLKIADYIEANL